MGKRESGQALVLVLLSLSVVLTLILFILSRSITDIAVSSRQEESTRAFSAAEAGIERSLVVGTSFATTGIGDAFYKTSVTNFAEGSTEIVYPSSLASGDSAVVWFMAHDPSTGNLTSLGGFRGSSMKVCWGDSAASASSPAIEVSAYYESIRGDLSTIKIAREAIDPYSGRNPPNSFSNSLDGGSCTIAGKSYTFQKTITFSSFSPAVNSDGLILARIKMFYNPAPQSIGVVVSGAGQVLPSQGQQIDSSGKAGESNRRIIVYQGWPEFPFASNSLIVPSGITK